MANRMPLAQVRERVQRFAERKRQIADVHRRADSKTARDRDDDAEACEIAAQAVALVMDLADRHGTPLVELVQQARALSGEE